MKPEIPLIICSTMPPWLYQPAWEIPKVLPPLSASKVKQLLENPELELVFVESGQVVQDGTLQRTVTEFWKIPQPVDFTAEQFKALSPGTEVTVLFASKGAKNPNYIVWRKGTATRLTA